MVYIQSTLLREAHQLYKPHLRYTNKVVNYNTLPLRNSIRLWEFNLMQHGNTRERFSKTQQNKYICFQVALRKWFYKYLCTTNRHVHIASISYNEFFLEPLKHYVIYAQAN